MTGHSSIRKLSPSVVDQGSQVIPFTTTIAKFINMLCFGPVVCSDWQKILLDTCCFEMETLPFVIIVQRSQEAVPTETVARCQSIVAEALLH